MYEWIQVNDTCAYLQGPAKVGVLFTGDDCVCLIDSGGDKDAGRKIRQQLQDRKLSLTAIYHTHSHADHMGGSRYLKSQYSCRIYAPEEETAMIRHPLLEPAFLYGGFPPAEWKHKFLMAQESDPEPLTESVLPAGIRVIPLPGHSFGMVGYRTAEGVVFLADCLASRQTLEKYGVVFVYDVKAYLRTLEEVAHMEASLFIPSHAEATENITPLAELNRAKTYEFGERVAELCREPADCETLLQRVFEQLGLVMTYEQYALVGSTLRSYLTWLQTEGMVTSCIDHNRLLWKKL